MSSIVFTGAGAISRAGDDAVKHAASIDAVPPATSADAYSLKDFKAAPYLSDRRTLKAVSATDAIGIAAIEQLKKDAGLAPDVYGADRIGLYIGAPPSSAWNVSDYFDIMRATREAAGVDSKAFGRECMTARPIALLTGLPNNVLCYGSILLDAKGPNSNYICGETSGQQAVVNAARRLDLGKLDLAVAGAFSAHGEPIVQSMMRQNGMLKISGEGDDFRIAPGGGGTISADGAFFFTLERQDAAAKRGAKVYAEYAGGSAASAGDGKIGGLGSEEAVGSAIRRCLAQAKVRPQDVGLVLASAIGIESVDVGERRAIDRVFAGLPTPAVGTTARVWGNLSEAGGLGEIALIKPLYERGRLPKSMSLGSDDVVVDAQRPYAVVIRTSIFGEASCLLLRHVA